MSRLLPPAESRKTLTVAAGIPILSLDCATALPTEPMKTTTYPHRTLACLLVVVLLLLSTVGFGLVLSIAQKEQTSYQHVGCGCITADDGGGESGCPASEAPHGDFSPSCVTGTVLPLYSPLVEDLHTHEPFRAPPQVYFELFVPPQNHC